jgi:hypothetical protein
VSALGWILLLLVAVPLAMWLLGLLLDSVKGWRAGPRLGPMGTGQRVALFVGLLFFLAGVAIGVRPLGHATGALGTLYCTDSPDTPIGQNGDWPQPQIRNQHKQRGS